MYIYIYVLGVHVARSTLQSDFRTCTFRTFRTFHTFRTSRTFHVSRRSVVLEKCTFHVAHAAECFLNVHVPRCARCARRSVAHRSARRARSTFHAAE